MREITYHNRRYLSYLRSNDSVISVDEEQVHFINGIAAVNITDSKGKMCSGIINEEYQEVFDDDEYQYGKACRNLMFLRYNTNIFRCGENDFIVCTRRGDDYHFYYTNMHIRIVDRKAMCINKDIGEYFKTNLENILIIGGNRNWHNKGLYDITKGKQICEGYDEISVIDGDPNRFFVKKRITSLTEESTSEDLYLTDNLYFQIDQNGHIISKVFSERKIQYLNYGDQDIDDYPMYCRQELVEESQKQSPKRKEMIDSLKYGKN